jgi:hypothetical protein
MREERSMRISNHKDAVLSAACGAALLSFSLLGAASLIRHGDSIYPNPIWWGPGFHTPLFCLVSMATVLGAAFVWRAASKWRSARRAYLGASDSNKGASRNGGPAERSENWGASGEPPSVS